MSASQACILIFAVREDRHRTRMFCVLHPGPVSLFLQSEGTDTTQISASRGLSSYSQSQKRLVEPQWVLQSGGMGSSLLTSLVILDKWLTFAVSISSSVYEKATDAWQHDRWKAPVRLKPLPMYCPSRLSLYMSLHSHWMGDSGGHQWLAAKSPCVQQLYYHKKAIIKTYLHYNEYNIICITKPQKLFLLWREQLRT